MAEFSKEYSEINGYEEYYFLYKDILEELQNGHYAKVICEALGTLGAYKRNNIYYLVVNYEGALTEYSNYIHSLKVKAK